MSAVEALQSAPQRAARSPAAVLGSANFVWRVLSLLNLFRLGLGIVLLGAFFLVVDPRIIGESNAELALGAMVTMIGS